MQSCKDQPTGVVFGTLVQLLHPLFEAYWLRQTVDLWKQPTWLEIMAVGEFYSLGSSEVR